MSQITINQHIFKTVTSLQPTSVLLWHVKQEDHASLTESNFHD